MTNNLVSSTELSQRLNKTLLLSNRQMNWNGILVVAVPRVNQVEEVAQAVVFHCSDAASYITRQPLVIDGGFTVN